MQIEINANKREKHGTGASRRMRSAGKVPGILYGAGKEAVSIELELKTLFLQFRHEVAQEGRVVGARAERPQAEVVAFLGFASPAASPAGGRRLRSLLKLIDRHRYEVACLVSRSKFRNALSLSRRA